MSDPSGEYTYICSTGPRRSMVLFFSDGTPKQHRREFKPDTVSTVKKPGSDESLYGNRVEGALFSKFLPLLIHTFISVAHWLMPFFFWC